MYYFHVQFFESAIDYSVNIAYKFVSLIQKHSQESEIVVIVHLFCYVDVELRLMFSLMDRVERGIDEMLRYLEEHIKNQGLADMIISATIITTVCCSCSI